MFKFHKFIFGAICVSGLSSSLALAGSGGVIVEGHKTPQIALGDTRAALIQKHPNSVINCQRGYDPITRKDFLRSLCTYQIDGIETVVRFASATAATGGSLLSHSPQDTVHQLSFSFVPWMTTRGVGIDTIVNDPDRLIAAYPNAELTYRFGNLKTVEDPEAGVRFTRRVPGYNAPDKTPFGEMDLFFPTTGNGSQNPTSGSGASPSVNIVACEHVNVRQLRNNRFLGRVTITNLSETSNQDWEVELNFSNATLIRARNANYTGGRVARVSGKGAISVIEPNASVSFNYVARGRPEAPVLGGVCEL